MYKQLFLWVPTHITVNKFGSKYLFFLIYGNGCTQILFNILYTTDF